MKAHKITIKRHALESDPRGFALDDVLESILLNSPPGGATTDQILKAGALYLRFMEDRKKNDGADSWDWLIERELFQTLLAQLDGMRWATTSAEVRLLLLAFVKEIRESKEIEVTIAATPAAEIK